MVFKLVSQFLLIKRESKDLCKIFYFNPFDELETGENKLKWLSANRDNFQNIDLVQIIPDKKNNWLNQTDNDWNTFLPMGSKENKLGKTINSIFTTYSNGVVTARDEWVYDFSKENLGNKIEFFIEKYNSLLSKKGDFDTIIKWSRDLKKKFERGLKLDFSKEKIRKSLYRPFLIKSLYFENILNDRQGLQPKIFPKAESENLVIGISGTSHSQPFSNLAISQFKSRFT